MLPRSVFFHIPKTGGTWVRQAIRNAGIPTVEVGPSPEDAENWHSPISRVDVRGKFTFAFVRHPLGWYPSFWSHRMRRGWGRGDLLDRYMAAEFERFMWNVIGNAPGHLSRRFEIYTGPRPGALDFVGRQENLERDLLFALSQAGEEFEEGTILATPLKNTGSNLPGYAPDLLGAVLESESRAILRFGYACAGEVASPC